MTQPVSRRRTRRRRSSRFGRTKVRKRLILFGAVAVVAAISAFLAISASDGTAPQSSSELPVEGAPDG
ncbi:hypothetical protein [Sphingomonas sp.]|uniref:hypothetical protein n=1 Tax=Sphingomonas sp. TaxID=28214 RepID=UPI003F7E807F